ncbi:MAG: hypothetical protein KDK36_21520 [Leptospiraceae bacterium]|nr:hypothetical protein [Leptospiraceae bacterium]
MKREKVIKLKKWTFEIKNSNEKRIKKLLKSIIPEYKTIDWTEETFLEIYKDILNSLPARYKQKNSIELSGRLKDTILEDAIRDKLNEFVSS